MLDTNRPPGTTTRRPWATVARNKSETIYEIEGFEQGQRVRRAEAVLARSLNTEAVIFDFGTHITSKAEAYTLIKSLGPLHGAKAVTQTRNSKNLLVEARFVNTKDSDQAMSVGVTSGDINFRATPAIAMESSLVKVNFKDLPFMSKEALTAGLRNNMGHYGRVCQIRLYLEPETETFDGEGTVILDVTPNTNDKYRTLTRYIHFDNWDRIFSVSWKGCPPICGFCKQEGHRQNKCGELQKVECYHCHSFGHFQKHCPMRRQQAQETRVQRMTEQELLDSFPSLQHDNPQGEQLDDDDTSIATAALESAHASAVAAAQQAPPVTVSSPVTATEKPDIRMGDGSLSLIDTDKPETDSQPDPKRQRLLINATSTNSHQQTPNPDRQQSGSASGPGLNNQ